MNYKQYEGAIQVMNKVLVKLQHNMMKQQVKKQINSCENSMIEVAVQVEQYLDIFMIQVDNNMQKYETSLRILEEKLRKHVKTEIQLKLYYEHLERVVEELKVDKDQLEKHIAILEISYVKEIQSLQTELSGHRNGNPTTISLNNKIQEKDHEHLHYQKTDIVSRIKKKLSHNNTIQFEKQPIKKINSKRNSLIQELKKLYKGQEDNKDKKQQSQKKKKKNQRNSKKKLQLKISRKNSNSLVKSKIQQSKSGMKFSQPK